MIGGFAVEIEQHIALHPRAAAKCIVKVDTASRTVEDNITLQQSTIGRCLEVECALFVHDSELARKVAQHGRSARLVTSGAISAKARKGRIHACRVADGNNCALAQPSK